MLKRIPKSDISIRPFKVYKEWSFDETNASGSSVFIYSASIGNVVNDFESSTVSNTDETRLYYPHSVYGQLRAQFYNGNEDNPFIRFGDKTNVYNTDSSNKERFLGTDAKVISIPQINIGEGIKKGSVSLLNGTTEYLDDKHGNLVSGSTHRIGNIFYSQGLIVITSGSNSMLTSSWELNYKSTETIYEYEYLLVLNESEFNVSTNPSAYVLVGRETASFTDSDGKTFNVITNPGVKYIRKRSTLENGDIMDYTYSGSISSSITNTWVSGGFEHYYLSSSVDSTGSFLTPFITTVGLYDDNCDLIAVAKLPKPIKSEPDIPLNFIIRFDT
jgi:hypothetical protein